MRAYTNLEQSKKLAEMLPIESADMYYTVCADEEDNAHDGYNDVRFRIENPFSDDELKKWYSCYEEIDWYDSPYIPCWSLATLLEMLPTIDDGNRNPVFCRDIRFNKWHIVYSSTAVEPKIDSGIYDNLIDACVEMIYKLKEQDLL